MTRRTRLSQRILISVACVMLAVPAGKVLAQEGMDIPIAEKKLGQLLFDVRHNILMDTSKEAVAYINEILNRKPTADDIVNVIEDPSPDNPLQGETGLIPMLEKAEKKAGQPELNKAARQLLDYIGNAYVEVITPDAINREIERLAGEPRAHDRALERLRKWSPWSVPMMVNVLLDQGRAKLHPYIVTALPEMGRPAVEPLCEALDLPGAVDVKMIVVQTLGKIGYPHAIPYLQRLAESTDSPQLKTACQDVIKTLSRTPRNIYSGSAAKMLSQLGEAYYTDQPSLRATVVGEKVPVWQLDPAKGGVVSAKVPRKIYNEAMALRSLTRSLRLDKAQPDAIALWLSASIRLEAQLGGEPNPVAPADQPRAHYFAVLAGPSVLLRALSRAIEDDDSAVQLGIIRALNDVGIARSATAGAGALQLAMLSQDLRVRTEAARLYWPYANVRLPGTDLAVRVLCDAVAQTGEKYAIVLSSKNTEQNKTLLEQLKAAGYTKVDVAAKRQAALDLARADGAPRVDLVVFAWDGPEGGIAGLNALREDFRFRRVPTLLIASAVEATEKVVADIPMVGVIDDAATAAVITGKVTALNDKNGIIPLTADDAKTYALKSAEVLGLLALSPATAGDALQAVKPLTRALADARLEVATAAGMALGSIDQEDAQRSLAAAVLDAKAEPLRRVGLAGALEASFKRFGCKLTEDQTKALVKGACEEPDVALRVELAKAAGAGNQTAQVVDLILSPPKVAAPVAPVAPPAVPAPAPEAPKP
ncbi:MAG: hypothetical protein PHU85_09435 [Phycisphaerae bacterium]|nr:hypothetical protein [Phycisphaerae bacterium]